MLSDMMTIDDAQREMRTRYVGGFYGQLVSGTLWLLSACLAEWRGPREAIITLVVGGVFIFPITELLIRTIGPRATLSANNTFVTLGMQVAFVLPASMPLLVPVGLYRLEWFYPGLMILVGAHYLPFAVLYGMRMFLALAVLLIAGGLSIAWYWPGSFSAGAWYTGAVLLLFAFIGARIANAEYRAAQRRPIATDSTARMQTPLSQS